MFSDILFYTLCYRSIEKASKEEIPFCFDMMKKEMAKHQERYTLLDELALGEEKEDEEEKKERRGKKRRKKGGGAREQGEAANNREKGGGA